MDTKKNMKYSNQDHRGGYMDTIRIHGYNKI